MPHRGSFPHPFTVHWVRGKGRRDPASWRRRQLQKPGPALARCGGEGAVASASKHCVRSGFSTGYWHRLFLSLQRYYQGEGVTGLLLLYPTYVVHTLEVRGRALVLEPKILVLSHNIPSRLFQQWSYKVLAVPSRHLGYDTSREEPIETITGECLAMLLKLGMHLLKYPKVGTLGGPLNLPDAVLEEVSNLIIPQDTIYHLLECRELLSPAQFLQAYDSPLNVVMDSVLNTCYPCRFL
uniref:Uncharacterized protein n=1 Tax=Chelonoidis abingdonii TaxID=106734 RepID=A0A8C0G6W0_CHEAB